MLQPPLKSLQRLGNYEKIGTYKLPLATPFGVYDFFLDYFEFPDHQRYSVLFMGVIKESERGLLVRINSECIWGRFGSEQCDCDWQFQKAKELIAREGRGMIIFAHDQIGKGVGLRSHALINAEAARRASDAPLYQQDIWYEGFKKLGFKVDYRSFDDVVEILKDYRIKKVRLLSNNQTKLDHLRHNGIEAEREPLIVPLNQFNKTEMFIKQKHGKHLLDIRS